MSKKIVLTPARRNALALLIEGHITENGLLVYGLQRRVLDALVEAGLAHWCADVRPSNWKITALGRKTLGGDNA